jgi:hypothetical protein
MEEQFFVYGSIIFLRNFAAFHVYSERRVLILNVSHSSLLKANAVMEPSNKLRPSPSESLPTHHL